MRGEETSRRPSNHISLGSQLPTSQVCEKYHMEVRLLEDKVNVCTCTEQATCALGKTERGQCQCFLLVFHPRVTRIHQSIVQIRNTYSGLDISVSGRFTREGWATFLNHRVTQNLAPIGYNSLYPKSRLTHPVDVFVCDVTLA